MTTFSYAAAAPGTSSTSSQANASATQASAFSLFFEVILFFATKSWSASRAIANRLSSDAASPSCSSTSTSSGVCLRASVRNLIASSSRLDFSATSAAPRSSETMSGFSSRAAAYASDAFEFSFRFAYSCASVT